MSGAATIDHTAVYVDVNNRTRAQEHAVTSQPQNGQGDAQYDAERAKVNSLCHVTALVRHCLNSSLISLFHSFYKKKFFLSFPSLFFHSFFLAFFHSFFLSFLLFFFVFFSYFLLSWPSFFHSFLLSIDWISQWFTYPFTRVHVYLSVHTFPFLPFCFIVMRAISDTGQQRQMVTASWLIWARALINQYWEAVLPCFMLTVHVYGWTYW